MRKSTKILLGIAVVIIISFGCVMWVQQAQETEALRKAQVEAEQARKSCELNEKLMDEHERLLGLTKGPIAEAEQKAKDFQYRCN